VISPRKATLQLVEVFNLRVGIQRLTARKRYHKVGLALFKDFWKLVIEITKLQKMCPDLVAFNCQNCETYLPLCTDLI